MLAFVSNVPLGRAGVGALQRQTHAKCSESAWAPGRTSLRRQKSSRAAQLRRGSSPSRELCASLVSVAHTATLVYGIVVGAGGVGAFLKTRSKASLISGLAAGALLAVAYAQSSIPLALGVAAALTVVFAMRYVKTKKMMPAGALGMVSAAAAVLFIVALNAA
ncbi:hypothetical protein CDCA_CDCA18G4519 [Cyanidium caldarium]|uniref:Transmembrane protein 14 n=1 Tax=Cyanidium caldarium TaxID=2771 RepID=A0AAV9J1S0_CYACA|nr:hypothetical protein CDCA_CDCA18G4519 [Cyanidium caldarium]